MVKKIVSKVFIADNVGGIEQQEIEIEELGDFEVLVKIVAFGINRADLLQVKGKYPPPDGENDILGLEYSGQVVKVGRSVRKILQGQSVAGLCGSGGYAEYKVSNENLLIPLPEKFDLLEAAGFPEVFATAFYNLFILNSVRKSQKILVHSAGGGVGLASIQLLIEIGAEVHAMVGCDGKVKKLGAFNLGGIYNYKRDGYEILESQHLDSFDFILDTVGGSLLTMHIKLLKQNGIVQNIGLLGGLEGKLDFAKFLKKNLTLSSSTLRNQPSDVKAMICDNLRQQVVDRIVNGSISLNIFKIFNADEIDRAFEVLRSNENFGKIIVRW